MGLIKTHHVITEFLCPACSELQRVSMSTHYVITRPCGNCGVPLQLRVTLEGPVEFKLGQRSVNTLRRGPHDS
jgi:transcription elongation factor Elf1